MAPVAGDVVGLVTPNAGANQIDDFLRRQVDYRGPPDPSSGRQAAASTTRCTATPPPKALCSA
jgi:hypothetical protein